MSNETEQNTDPGYDANTDIDYTVPNSTDITKVPSVAGYFDGRTSTSKPTEGAVEDELSVWADRIRLTVGLGIAAQRMTNPLMGFNHMMANNPIPVNREYGGLTFFTRPDFNLDYNNIANSRRFSNMAMQPRSSLDYSLLAALDPDFELGFSDSPRDKYGRRLSRLGTPFMPDVPFDNLQAFIPLLSTQLVSLSGMPDESVDNWMSDEGIKREQWGMVDSTHEINNQFSLSTSLTNPYGNAIMRLASIWIEYMSGVKEGRFMPKIRNSIQRRIDYQSRIYGMRYDPLGNITRFWTACVAWPMNNNAGQMASVDNSKPQMNDDTNISLQWQCIGARYDDPLYMDMFNATVSYFNPDMSPTAEAVRTGNFTPQGMDMMQQIPPQMLPLFNYYGYPHIDPIRRKLSWWVYNVDYQRILKKAGLI
ncbi:putative virion structural protein [Erwinia phage vB_EamM_Caitlin]|uniref:putative virion structural protein n=1 Tax=Erwinia phage vB_EamM_Caitlin TaxID=1883379 RepID=UPI00081D0CE1|nr:putative virion structural protein [Erwinia phage vB_EamM_Caitlin]ANZ48354.1 putative virion structural protein [Erwinia phage vB_EamM_Caitlin]